MKIEKTDKGVFIPLIKEADKNEHGKYIRVGNTVTVTFKCSIEKVEEHED